ncbi:MAG TPA: hypothetical protein VJN21_12390 [Candidatus Acidoferrales bacterium]|nr:hypothetical protein [Candidatus Acidoferrales bacterium]
MATRSALVLLRWKIKLRYSTALNFIHNNVFNHPLAKWIASNVAVLGLMGAGIAVAQWDEYAVAFVLFFLGSAALGLKAYHWQTDHGITKFLLVICALVGMGASYPITIAKKGTKPWSDVIYRISYVSSLTRDELGRVIVAPSPPTGWDKEQTPGIPAALPVMRPDIVGIIVNPMTPALIFYPLHAVAEKVEADPVLFDIDREDGKTDSLNITQMKFDWLRMDQHAGPTALLDSRDVGTVVRNGHRIFGFVQIACPQCQRIRIYWVYFVYGRGGRYAENTIGAPNLKAISVSISEMRTLGPERFLDTIKGWKPIVQGPEF